MNQSLNLEIVIIGGGIAGLWTLHRLQHLGYQAILLEKNALGSHQTIASQGIIHGGIKYALSGEISESSRQISDMPLRWQASLKRQGEIDLTAVNILSDNYYLCSQQKITQKITQFFAQKALRSDSDALSREEYPPFFQHPDFHGLLTRVHECVLDVPSLIHALSKPMMPYIFKVDDVVLKKNQNDYDVIANGVTITAKKIILTAGESNETLFPAIKMQKRPLQMVMLKADNLPQIFVHCVQLSTNPIITITSHRDKSDHIIWYLGGQLAEDGVGKDPASQISTAQAIIKQQFPWFTPVNPKWQTLLIDRAEGFHHGKRPESIIVQHQQNIISAWPTKLTFAPLLADAIIKELQTPSGITSMPALLSAFPKPEVAQPIWEHIC